jgi:hypothetical protein
MTWDVDLALFVIIGLLRIIGVHVGVPLALWHYSSPRRNRERCAGRPLKLRASARTPCVMAQLKPAKTVAVQRRKIRVQVVDLNLTVS